MVFASAEDFERLEKEALAAGFSVTVLMEQAGLHLARFLEGNLTEKARRILMLVGRGHNGGDGLVAARHLCNWGYQVDVLLAEEETKLKPATKRQLHILRHINNCRVWGTGNLKPFALRGYIICDALLGSGLSGDPKTAYTRLINAANKSKMKTYSCDVPSGLHATTGAPGIPTIISEATMTLGIVKSGLMVRGTRTYVGKLYLADLGIPEYIYKQCGLESAYQTFKKKGILRVK